MGKYTDEQKAEALVLLDANNGNMKKTAAMLGIPRATLQTWAKGSTITPEIEAQRQEKRIKLADRLLDIAHLLVDAIPEKIKSANLQSSTIALGIVVEKAELLLGEPTARQEISGAHGEPLVKLDGLSDDDIDRILAAAARGTSGQT